MHNFYKSAILEAVNACEDTNLLDLVLKMLLESAKHPGPVEPIKLEVTTNANHPGDKRLHRAIPIQICNDPTHPATHCSGVGNRREELPRVCGGADSLPSAA